MTKPKHIRFISDIHLDFDAREFFLQAQETSIEAAAAKKPLAQYLWEPKPLPDDHEGIFMILGDIWTGKMFYQRVAEDACWLERLASRFMYVVLLLGNHDYWNANLHSEAREAQEAIDKLGLKNVFLIEESTVRLPGLKIVGGTLWTDFGKRNPIALAQAPMIMNDYRKMVAGKPSDPRAPTPEDIYEIHARTKKYIFNHVAPENPEQLVIVATHMAPSYNSIHGFYRFVGNEIANFYYYSNLEERIRQHPSIAFWLHGHCHYVADYKIGETRVLCNPRGYKGYEYTNYDPFIKIDLATREVIKSGAIVI